MISIQGGLQDMPAEDDEDDDVDHAFDWNTHSYEMERKVRENTR